MTPESRPLNPALWSFLNKYPDNSIFDMTDDQWTAIQAHIMERLQLEESFEVRPDELIRQFGLTPPFYRQMISHAELTKANFNFNGHWKNADGDPSDPIQFSRKI